MYPYGRVLPSLQGREHMLRRLLHRCGRMDAQLVREQIFATAVLVLLQTNAVMDAAQLAREQ